MEDLSDGRYALLEIRRTGRSTKCELIEKFGTAPYARFVASGLARDAKTKKFVIVDIVTQDEIARFEKGHEMKAVV